MAICGDGAGFLVGICAQNADSMTTNFLSLLIIALLSTTLSCQRSSSPLAATSTDAVAAFDRQLDSLFHVYKLPGMSVAVVKGDSVVYKRGFGYADVEQQRPATPLTTYRVASLTKPISATLLLQQQEAGVLSLDDSIKQIIPGYEAYYEQVKNYILTHAPKYAHLVEDFDYTRHDISIRHHLTHTAQHTPGDTFSYNGFLYGALSQVLAIKLQQPFEEQLQERIFSECGMTYSAPSQAYADTTLLALPYHYLVERDTFLRSPYPSPDVNAAAGIVSNVIDLAKFDNAIDHNQLIDAATQALAWTNQRTNSGERIPYGLGWFVQSYRGQPLVWHYGWQPEAFSRLYLKVPESDLTLIMLANSEDLSAPFMEQGYDSNVLASPFARVFLESFVR